MTELKTTPSGAPAQRKEELRTSGGPVELSFDQLARVAGGGFILAERMPRNPPSSLGFILAE